MIRARSLLWIALVVAGCHPARKAPPVASHAAALDGRDGNAYVNFHRDRLLDAYAANHGFAGRADAWNNMNSKQRWLFLIQTDLLGNRTYMTPWVYPVLVNNPDDGCYYGDGTCGEHEIIGGQDAYGPGCVLWAPDGDGNWGCNYLDTRTCLNQGLCGESSTPTRYDFSMALEHVNFPYEMLAPSGDCGGDDNNRIFWQADDPLIQAFRNRTTQNWGANGDLGGPHAPFNNASSTYNGRPFSCDGPDGQAQFYSYDWQAQPFWRGSTYLPADGHMFELDDDYDTVHHSSPECFYCGGTWAVTMYEQHWCPSQGNFAPCDWSYSP